MRQMQRLKIYSGNFELKVLELISIYFITKK